MTRVVCFGEALIDFLNTGRKQVERLETNDFRQFPGGAPANVAVAVAKLGGDAWFAGQVGNDQFGEFLLHSLRTYDVHTDFVSMHPEAKTALAFVFLDDDGDRSFSFRRERTADMVFREEQISDDWYKAGDLFHFCSNTLTTPEIARVTETSVRRARAAGSIVSFDVNLRHNLWANGEAERGAVNSLLAICDIVKFSREELDYLSDGQGAEWIGERLDEGTSLVLVTDGPAPVFYYGSGFEGDVVPSTQDVVDTTAAGDGFMGSLLFGLSRLGDARAAIEDHETVRLLTEFATECGAFTVTSAGAFPSLPRFEDVSRYWRLQRADNEFS